MRNTHNVRSWDPAIPGQPASDSLFLPLYPSKHGVLKKREYFWSVNLLSSNVLNWVGIFLELIFYKVPSSFCSFSHVFDQFVQ